MSLIEKALTKFMEGGTGAGSARIQALLDKRGVIPSTSGYTLPSGRLVSAADIGARYAGSTPSQLTVNTNKLVPQTPDESPTISRQELSDRQVKQQAEQQQTMYDQQIKTMLAQGQNVQDVAGRNLFPEGPNLPQYGQYGGQMISNPYYRTPQPEVRTKPLTFKKKGKSSVTGLPA